MNFYMVELFKRKKRTAKKNECKPALIGRGGAKKYYKEVKHGRKESTGCHNEGYCHL